MVLQNHTFVTVNKKEQCACTVLLYNRKLAQDLDVRKYLLFRVTKAVTVYKTGNLVQLFHLFIFAIGSILLQETARGY
jgi:hypothetical protein